MSYLKRVNTAMPSSGPGADATFRPKPGSNVLRVYTWDRVVKERDFVLKRYDPNRVKVGDVVTERSLQAASHFVASKPVGPCKIISDWAGIMHGTCPHCENYEKEVRVRGRDDRATQMLRRTERNVLVVMDRTAPGIFKYWEASPSVTRGLDEEEVLSRLASYRDRLYGPNGIDVEVIYNKGAAVKSQTYRVSFGDPASSPTLPPMPDSFDPYDQAYFVPPEYRYLYDGSTPQVAAPARPQGRVFRLGDEVRVDFGGDGVHPGRVVALLPNGALKVLMSQPVLGQAEYEVSKEECV